ncbi:lim domain-containing protein [Ophiostoma piceae UAMH 11346]|uniref:Lim domain-containing protein n=1 Tax=Ophiostoma piceae (strain UAMH 11346) TaxID=1262450 RepID=S3C8P7_OPHP1|nr:lim domain-containing protein [Ophiostoma piceae UAMH 11346]
MSISIQDNTNRTDRSYHRPGQLTPVSNSSSGSQSVSPKTPVGTSSGRVGMGNVPSNDNAGEYFEPTIAGEYDSPSQRRPGGYGGLGPVDEPDSFAPNNGNSNYNNNYAPMGSPMKPAGNSLLQRMNTITPGPFDVNRRPSNALARQERAERDEEFEAPSFGRAGTFPRLNSQTTEPPSRAPSAPGLRPEHRRQPSNISSSDSNDGFYRSSTARMGPDTSRAPPPRTSLLRPRTAGRDGSGSSSGSVPQINLADEFGIGNPYHSPHDSMSSTVSSLSRPSIPFSSSQSSFSSAFSASSFSTSSSINSLNQVNQDKSSQFNQAPPARKNSNNADFDSLLNDLQSMKTTDRGMPSPQMQQSPTMGSGFAGFDRRPSQDPSQMRRPSQDPPQRRPSQDPSQYPSQDRRPSQNDRARVGGYGGLGSNNNDYSSSYDNKPYDNGSSNNSYGRVSPERNLQSRGRDDMDTSYARTRTPAPAAAPPPSRGNCKACGDLITGKSVSSADGRLTGRYHKACFVCTTCSEPFTSAEFYVHNDMPYCERHYHEVNGSLCGTCNNGIEGHMGMSSGMGNGPLAPPRQYGLPSGNRLGPGPRPRMEKRMTRLGMM